ncbi:MAG: DUF2029 domain-containing protein [Chloroflexi bacterium]|nr:DUF2029 domain-containing protein [Chloroflexota bacterium]
MLIFYLFQIGQALYFNNLFNTLGSDFLGFWTAGHMANTQGYARIYDANLVSRIQKPYHEVIETDNIYAPIMTAFFPVFGIPFQLLALLKASHAFTFWSILNFVALILYLRFFIHDLLQKSIPPELFALLIISYPVFHNFFWGQLDVWLLICMGEFMRAVLHKKPFISGLWLAGMLAKPQALILIIPALFLRRAWKELAGFTTGVFAIFIISFLLVGTQGLRELLNVWLGFASGIPTNAPDHMVNWRMIMVQWNALTNSNSGVVIAVLGSFVTLLISVFIWRKSAPVNSEEFPVVLLGLIASTAVFTWHSHIHMMLVLLPPFLYLAIQNRLPAKIINYWVFGPPIALMLSFICLLFTKFGILPDFGYEALFLGLWGFSFNLIILAWVISTRRFTSPHRS